MGSRIRYVQDEHVDWDRIEPLFIKHYLWTNNGYEPEVQIRLFYNKDSLHLHFRTYEENPLVSYYKLNDPVYKDSCVEFFLQPQSGTDERYLNFELNAAGALLLGLGKDRHSRQYLTGWPAGTFRIETKTGRTDRKDGRTFWELQYAVPFRFLQSIFEAFSPVSGTMVRANFYKCGDDTPAPHYGCWSLVRSAVPDFHRSADFGELIFD